MNQALLKQVLECPKLPTLPSVAVRVVELTNDPNVRHDDLTQVIQNDQGLSTKILRTVNSAFYGLSTPCSTISRAQVLLGMSAIRTLALGFSLVSSLKEETASGFDYLAYWRRGLYTGVAAKAVAGFARDIEPEEALLGGLLQDLGMIALYRALGERYLDVVYACEGRHALLADLERDRLDLDHAVVGSALAKQWRLPATLTTCIRYHNQPDQAPEQHREMVRCVSLGNLLSKTLAGDGEHKALHRFVKGVSDWFGLDESEGQALVDVVVENAGTLGDLLELPSGASSDAAVMIERARDTLVDLAVGDPADHGDAPAADAGEAGFNEQLAGAHARSVEDSSPLAVIVVAVGELVASPIAAGLLDRAAERAGVRPLATGLLETGDAALLMPGMDRRAAGIAGARLRQALSDLCEEPEPVRVGVAATDGGPEPGLDRPEALLAAARRACEAACGARDGGVLVFRPRPAAA